MNTYTEDYRLDELDLELFEADKENQRNFVTFPGDWSQNIPADPFMVQ